MPDESTTIPQSIDEVTDPIDGFYENEDGIYEGIPDVDYHGDTQASGRCSQSALSELWTKSPAHARAKMDREYDPTPAKRFGRALHTAVLQPSVFDTEYAVKERCSGIKGGGDRCTYDGKHPWICEDVEHGSAKKTVRWFCSTHEPQAGDAVGRYTVVESIDTDTLSEKKMDKITRMQDALRSHPAASRLLYDVGGEEVASELTVLWTYDPLDIQCKSRIDRLAFTDEIGPVIIDLKTTRSAKPGTTPDTLGYSAAKYGYHRQAAFYMRAVASRGIPVEHYFLVAIEKKRPHDACCFQFQQEALMQGEDEIVKALRRFDECQEVGEWPGYQDTIEPLDLPPWAYED